MAKLRKTENFFRKTFKMKVSLRGFLKYELAHFSEKVA